MKAVGMMRCAHCGVPLQIEVTSGVSSIVCSKCDEPSLAIAISNGTFGSVRLRKDIMNSEVIFRRTEHVRDQLVWYLKQHPELIGLEQIADVLTRKLADEMRFADEREMNRLQGLDPIKDSEVKGFHLALLPNNTCLSDLEML